MNDNMTVPITTIKGVLIKKLSWIPDERGRLIEILRNDETMFEGGFGQVYVTTIKPGTIKAWHCHEHQDDRIVVISGMVRLGLYCAKTKQTKTLFIGDWSPAMIRIPKHVYHGFKGIGDKEAVVMNLPTKAYNHENPDEIRVDPFSNDISYDWNSGTHG